MGRGTWIWGVVLLLVPNVWSQDPGTNGSVAVVTSTHAGLGSFSPRDVRRIIEVRNVSATPGTDYELRCTNKTWTDTLYVIWTLTLKHRKCEISASREGQRTDTCRDGKSLEVTSGAQTHLRIPKFLGEDVGTYLCETAFDGGNTRVSFNVTATVRPTASAWLERAAGKMVAVCRAEGAEPGAVIRWSVRHNRSSVGVIRSGAGGVVAVESRLELEEDGDARNLTCAVTYPYRAQAEILVPQIKKDTSGYFLGLFVVVGAVALALLMAFAVLAHRKLLTRRWRHSDTSLTRSPTVEEVEEVEPYASYIQRVNSIYN